MKEAILEKFRRILCMGPAILLSSVSVEVVCYKLLNYFSYPLGLSLKSKTLLSLPFFALFLTGYIAFWRTYLAHNVGTAVVQTGPFRFVRHPLYATDAFSLPAIAAFWLNDGMFFISWAVILVIVYAAARREERFMLERFGDEYSRYRSDVPAIFPYRALLCLLKKQGRGVRLLCVVAALAYVSAPAQEGFLRSCDFSLGATDSIYRSMLVGCAFMAPDLECEAAVAGITEGEIPLYRTKEERRADYAEYLKRMESGYNRDKEFRRMESLQQVEADRRKGIKPRRIVIKQY